MLELSHIYKTFNQGTIDEKVLFSDFNITVNDGDFVGVIGSNVPRYEQKTLSIT